MDCGRAPAEPSRANPARGTRQPPARFVCGGGEVRERVTDIQKETPAEELQVRSDRLERRGAKKQKVRAFQAIDELEDEDVGVENTPVLGAAERNMINVTPARHEAPPPQVLAHGQVLRGDLDVHIRPGNITFVMTKEQSEEGLVAEEQAQARRQAGPPRRRHHKSSCNKGRHGSPAGGNPTGASCGAPHVGSGCHTKYWTPPTASTYR